MPNAAALRMIAPTLPGSCTPSRKTRASDSRASARPECSISAAMPCGVSASTMALNTLFAQHHRLRAASSLRSRGWPSPASVTSTARGLSPVLERCGDQVRPFDHRPLLAPAVAAHRAASFAQRLTSGCPGRLRSQRRRCGSRRRCRRDRAYRSCESGHARCRGGVAKLAPRSTLCVPNHGSEYSLYGSRTKPGIGQESARRPFPHMADVLQPASAAYSHSASVGSRRPAHRSRPARRASSHAAPARRPGSGSSDRSGAPRRPCQ